MSELRQRLLEAAEAAAREGQIPSAAAVVRRGRRRRLRLAGTTAVLVVLAVVAGRSYWALDPLGRPAQGQGPTRALSRSRPRQYRAGHHQHGQRMPGQIPDPSLDQSPEDGLVRVRVLFHKGPPLEVVPVDPGPGFPVNFYARAFLEAGPPPAEGQNRIAAVDRVIAIDRAGNQIAECRMSDGTGNTCQPGGTIPLGGRVIGAGTEDSGATEGSAGNQPGRRRRRSGVVERRLGAPGLANRARLPNLTASPGP